MEFPVVDATSAGDTSTAATLPQNFTNPAEETQPQDEENTQKKRPKGIQKGWSYGHRNYVRCCRPGCPHRGRYRHLLSKTIHFCSHECYQSGITPDQDDPLPECEAQGCTKEGVMRYSRFENAHFCSTECLRRTFITLPGPPVDESRTELRNAQEGSSGNENNYNSNNTQSQPPQSQLTGPAGASLVMDTNSRDGSTASAIHQHSGAFDAHGNPAMFNRATSAALEQHANSHQLQHHPGSAASVMMSHQALPTGGAGGMGTTNMSGAVLPAQVHPYSGMPFHSHHAHHQSHQMGSSIATMPGHLSNDQLSHGVAVGYHGMLGAGEVAHATSVLAGVGSSATTTTAAAAAAAAGNVGTGTTSAAADGVGSGGKNNGQEKKRKYRDGSSNSSEKLWSPDMDRRMMEYGIDDWFGCAAHVGNNVTNVQCSMRWKFYANPALKLLKNGPWTSAEVQQLHELAPQFTRPGRKGRESQIDWEPLAALMGRSYMDCQSKWSNIQRAARCSSLKKGSFTQEEDERIFQRYLEWEQGGKVRGKLWPELGKELNRRADYVKQRWDLVLSKRDPFMSSIAAAAAATAAASSNQE